MHLSEEQKRLIEENKRRALEKLVQKRMAGLTRPTTSTTTVSWPSRAPIDNTPAAFVPFQVQSDTSTAKSDESPIIPPLSSSERQNAAPKPKAAEPTKLAVNLELDSSDYFTCPHIPHLYDKIKAISGVVFCHQDKTSENKRLKKESYWRIPISQYQSLLEVFPLGEKPSPAKQIPENVLKLFANPSEIARKKSTISFDLTLLEENIRTSLFPFQRDGIQIALARNGRIILADDMGLGKSIQSLGIASYYRREWPLLIISPASMVSSWHEQVMKWYPSVAPNSISVIYDGKGKLDGLINIGSFDLLTKIGDMVASKKFQVIIVDESHALKNPESKRSKTLIPIIMKASRAILLSGTPALSRPCELYPQIKAVSPKLFPHYIEFCRRYCDAKQTHFGWDMKGSSNTQELQIILENTIMIRRTKAEVLTQLPPKVRQQVFLKVDTKNLKQFDKGKAALSNIEDLSAFENRNELMDLWRKTSEVKAPVMLEYIKDLLEAGHKCLVFAHHKNVLDVFEDAFINDNRKYIRIDGATATSIRQGICTKFQTDKDVRVALLSITAANTGLTLTAATTVIFAELYWNPGQMVQAEDRAHRIGQCDSVSVHYLLAKGTTDDTLWYQHLAVFSPKYFCRPLILKKLNTLESCGLGKNDFKGIANREHDPDQLTLEKAWKRPKLDFEELPLEQLSVSQSGNQDSPYLIE